MKRIDLIIPHERLHDVNELLRNHKVGGLTFYDIKGRGRAKNEPVAIGTGVMRYIPEFGSRTKIEVLVPDPIVKPIIDDVLKLISMVLLLMERYLSTMLQNLTILAVKKPVIKLYRVTCCTCSFFNGVPPKNLSQDYSLDFSGLFRHVSSNTLL